MIRIERGEEVKRRGVWEYRIPSLQICGKSRQPLLDACRKIVEFLGETKSAGQRVGIFREGKTEPDMTCMVLDGAKVTVFEPNNGKIKFAKFVEFDREAFKEAAE